MNEYYVLAGAIIRQAIRDRKALLAGRKIPGVTLGSIRRFFKSENFEILAGPYADLIRAEVFKDE